MGRRSGSHWLSLVAFLVLVSGGGLAIGYVTAPGAWYAQLAKPAFNPPSLVFGLVWPVLYILIAVAGWRIWRRDRGGRAMTLWWAQLGLNFAWPPVFFSAHGIGLALVIVVVLFAVVLAFMAAAWRRDRVAAFLFAPYAVWVAFAAVLNAMIWSLNPAQAGL